MALTVFIVGLTGYIVYESFAGFLIESILRQVYFIVAIIVDLLFIGFIFTFVYYNDRDLEKLK